MMVNEHFFCKQHEKLKMIIHFAVKADTDKHRKTLDTNSGHRKNKDKTTWTFYGPSENQTQILRVHNKVRM